MDFERTFPRVCEQRLNGAGAGPWEVLTFGVAGWGTAQELLAYRELGRRFEPDLVVLAFFSGNDVSDNSSELSSNPRVYFRLDSEGRLQREPSLRARRWASDVLNRHSRFYVWQKAQVHRLELLFRARVVVNPVHRVFAETYEPELERAWAVTRALITELRDETRADDADLLALYVPYSDEVNPDWWRDTVAQSPPLQGRSWDLGKPERLLAAFCRERGIPLVSPRSAFLAAAGEGERLYFVHGHLDENGHRRLGELLAEGILARARETGVLAPGEPPG